jgi:NAD(P)H-dependent flavin oxidoreductase YrpB (nitropropane dioxygenase family)
VKALNSIRLSGADVLPLIEGGKGVAISSGTSSGAWAAAGGIGTFSGVNADSYDADGNVILQVYHAGPGANATKNWWSTRFRAASPRPRSPMKPVADRGC